MCMKTAWQVLISVSVLSVGVVPHPCAAMNPNFAQTSILSPQEGETLFTLYFTAKEASWKQGRNHNIKETYFVPNSAEIEQARASMYELVRINLDTTWNQFESSTHNTVLTTDFQQYAGVMCNGEKRILIRGYPVADDNDFITSLGGYTSDIGWQKRRSRPSDGGSGFQAVYDPDKHRIVYMDFDRFIKQKTGILVY